MKFISTRAKSPAVSFSEAMNAGLAPDGGLYVPENFPIGDHSYLDPKGSYAKFASEVVAPYLAGDALGKERASICAAAFDFPIPLRLRKDGTGVLELFHGPTAAFKDVGARFLAECLARESRNAKRTVLVATSGDTGGAVAAAFNGKPNLDVFVLYPKGKISLRQEKQIAGWGGSIRAVAVRGTFDDCQRIVKEAMRDRDLSAKRNFVSANSINIARLLAQVTYYAKSSMEYWQHTGESPGFVVPTGNLGNAFAALWAKKIGFPIDKVVLASNSNRAVADFVASGKYEARSTIATLANAMDVGDPSNMERLQWLYPQHDDLLEDVEAVSVGDDEIRSAIRESYGTEKEIWCPHTATAVVARKKLGGSSWILVATAHAAKFETIVEPLIGKPVDVPPSLAALLGRENQSVEIEPTLFDFKRYEITV